VAAKWSRRWFTSRSVPTIPANVDPLTDPYAVLGVDETATWAEISAAHRRLAMAHHPDRAATRSARVRARSEEHIRLVNIAYTELRRRRGR
jgi:curved DNA-binding protein CbpA